MRVPLLLTLAVLALVLWASEADGAPRDPRPAGVEDFAFALGIDVDSGAEAARLPSQPLGCPSGQGRLPHQARS